MHDSFMALGGMIPLINMMLGEIIIGGVGAGFYGIVLFIVVTIFVAGLTVGWTPEYLGKKIEAKEMKMAILSVLCLPRIWRCSSFSDCFRRDDTAMWRHRSGLNWPGASPNMPTRSAGGRWRRGPVVRR